MTPTSVPTRPGRATMVLILVAMIPMVVGAVTLANRGWAPSGEFAQADLRMQDFWSHPPQRCHGTTA